jgi:hypothetical protein
MIVLLIRWEWSQQMRWSGHFQWEMGHQISSILNHKKIHSSLSFSCTSFLSIFYQKITCNYLFFSFPYYSQKSITLLTTEAGRHRCFHSTKAPYHSMIKLDRTMWSTIAFSKQLSFQLHILKIWWLLMLTPICYNVH